MINIAASWKADARACLLPGSRTARKLKRPRPLDVRVLATPVWSEACAGENRVRSFTGKVDCPAAAARRPAMALANLSWWPRLALAQFLLHALQQGLKKK
jgi:hypothetical protein